MSRLLLVRHAATAATEAGAFGADEPITAQAEIAARALSQYLPHDALALTSPSRRCRQTAQAAGFTTATIEAALAECDFGDWEGQTLAQINERNPVTVSAWLTDPAAAPHGGESFEGLMARIEQWLTSWIASQPDVSGRFDSADACLPTVAFTHAGPIKAAVLTALQTPATALWRLALAPLSITELACYDGNWVLERFNWQVAV